METSGEPNNSVATAFATEGPVEDSLVAELMERLRKAITPNEEDEDQKSLVVLIQENRALLLRYAMTKYLENPKSASLLEGVTSLIGQMEKTVRDDRKERSKKEENQNNKLAFNQMLDAMKSISDGKIEIPSFDMSLFMLDPTKPLPGLSGVKPISAGELTQGNDLVDLDGNPI